LITALSASESHELLRSGRIARLGCVVDGEPYVVPVNYFIEGEYAYVHSLPGRKIEALRAHPRACLQLDEIKDYVDWHSVLAYGTYEEIKSPDERARVLNAFSKHFPLLTPVESTVIQDATPPAIIAFRLRLDSVTGVKEG
jgi:uncharacterized protein